MAADSFVPFADDARVAAIAGLTVENGTERVLIHGDLELTRDRRGLEHARSLAALVDATVRALEAEPGLPEAVARAVAPPARVRNPFA